MHLHEAGASIDIGARTSDPQLVDSARCPVGSRLGIVQRVGDQFGDEAADEFRLAQLVTDSASSDCPLEHGQEGKRSTPTAEASNRTFSARNKRHRRKLLEDDSLIEFVAWNEDAQPLWRSLVEIQLRYRHDHGCLDRSYTAQGARSFESHVRLVGEDGEPLERPLPVL